MQHPSDLLPLKQNPASPEQQNRALVHTETLHSIFPRHKIVVSILLSVSSARHNDNGHFGQPNNISTRNPLSRPRETDPNTYRLQRRGSEMVRERICRGCRL